jgi:predicted transcriptional regulator
VSRDRELGLSGRQLALMRILWEQGEARVAEVHAAMLHSERPIAATTVATLLSRLEKRGLIEHRTEGRQFVYRAVKSEAAVSRSMVRALTKDLFGGDALQLMAHLVREGEVAPGDLAEIQRMLEAEQRARESDAKGKRGM